MERLRGKLRISVRSTDDGLGIHIPPSRNIAASAFLSLWLIGWAAGEYFALGQFFSGGISITDLFLLLWLVPWTLGGAGVLWVLGWQLFGVERLFVTAGALVREWGLLGIHGRRLVRAADIVAVKADSGAVSDLAGLGTITVTTTGPTMRIGAGLTSHEAEFVAGLIRSAAIDHPQES